MIQRKSKTLALLMAFTLFFSLSTVLFMPITAYAEVPVIDEELEQDDLDSDDLSDPTVTNPTTEKDTPKPNTDIDEGDSAGKGDTSGDSDNTNADPSTTPGNEPVPGTDPVPAGNPVIEPKEEVVKPEVPSNSETVTAIPNESVAAEPITPASDIPITEDKASVPYKMPYPGYWNGFWTIYYPANFYIINGVDADIPEEPNGHPTEGYSSGITIERAIASYDTVVDSTGSDKDLAGDNFTANNAVLNSLHHYPSAEDIKEVVPTFDPETQYVVWYVKKFVSTNSGVHVDGVIRNKEVIEEIQEPVGDYPNVSIEIYTTCEDTEIEYDGKEHIIGGFHIEVKDLDNKAPTFRNIFNALGELVTVEASAAANGEGTFFSNNGVRYWVNIDAAYVVASEIKTYTIPFIFNGKEIAPEDIVVKYEKDGQFVSLPSGVIMQQKPTTAKLNVKQRNITLEAGTTVKNYDGSTITNDKVEITSGSLMGGHKLKNVVINGSQSVIGSSKNEITSFMIVDENGKDVTHLYNVKCVDGKLELVNDGTYTPESDHSDKAANATASISGIGHTIVINNMEETDAQVTVLGATKQLPRMGQTGDETDIAKRLIIIAAALATIAVLTRKKYAK